MQLPNEDAKGEGGGEGGGGEGAPVEAAEVGTNSSHRHQQQPQQPQQPMMMPGVVVRHECSACSRPITDRYLLKAIDRYWHEDCLKCSCCDCRLGEVGSTLFTKADLLLCRRDYLRLFGTTGYCSACSKLIPAFEMVMRARDNVYHLECFACQQCSQRFCVGDRYYLLNNQILCEFDYEESLLFSGSHHNHNHQHHHHNHNHHHHPPPHPPPPPHHAHYSPHQPTAGVSEGPSVAAAAAAGGKHHGALQHQAANQGLLLTDDGSSGYGSPSPTSV